MENQTNNHYLDFDNMNCQFLIILEILKKHSFNYALSETAEVAEIYVQQFWLTLEYVKLNWPGASHFTGWVDDYEFQLTFI